MEGLSLISCVFLPPPRSWIVRDVKTLLSYLKELSLRCRRTRKGSHLPPPWQWRGRISWLNVLISCYYRYTNDIFAFPHNVVRLFGQSIIFRYRASCECFSSVHERSTPFSVQPPERGGQGLTCQRRQLTQSRMMNLSYLNRRSGWAQKSN